MIQVLISQAGKAEVDYSRYVDWKSLQIVDKVNVPTQATINVAPSDSVFLPPLRSQYVRILSTQTGRSLFTGFISSETVKSFIGQAPFGAGAKNQVFQYSLTCTSDEYLLNIKSIPFIPAFVNRTQGQILSSLAEILCPGYFDTSGIQDGDIIPYFTYDPQQSWCEIAKLFGDASRFRYKAKDKKLFYVPYGDQPLGISYDEQLKESTFAPKGLSTTVLAVPIINDVTVVGDTEAGNNREDYFIGDGFTGNFALRHKMFLGSTSVLVQETWQNSALNTQQWFLQDPFGETDFSAGALNIVSGSGSPHTLGDAYLQLNNGLELGGGLCLDHGEFTFNDYCLGILGGLYADTTFGATGFLGGFKVSSPSGVVTSASGAAGVVIQPWWAALGGGPVLVSKIDHSYVLQTVITAPRYTRYKQLYRTIEGEEYGGGTDTVFGSVTFIMQDYDVRAASGFYYVPEITKWTLSDVELPAFAVYALTNNQRLNLTIDKTTIALMPLGSLLANVGPSGLISPTGLVLPLLPVGSGEYTGPVQPWPSFASGNILPPPGVQQGWQDQVLGNGLQLQVAQITQGNEVDTLAFYAQELPVAGTPIRLQSWEAQAAVARLQNADSITAEAELVGDDGIRSSIVSDLNPLPRTSEDAANAAQAFLFDRSKVFYNGTYECTSWFFQGLTSDEQYWPCPGRFLNIHSPDRDIKHQKFIVVGVTISFLEAFTEQLNFQISFGADLHLEKVLKHFVDLKPVSVLTPTDKANPPNPRFIGDQALTFLPDLVNARAVSVTADEVQIQILDGPAYAIEVRTQDAHWGRGITYDYVGTFSAPTITLRRLNYDQTWYMRLSASGITSKRSKVFHVKYPLRPATPVLVYVQGASINNNGAFQFDYNGDQRSIYGLEVRASDNKTILLQKPVASYADMFVDLTQTPFSTLDATIIDTSYVLVYFFNLMWNYSAPPLVAQLGPSGGFQYIATY